MFALLVVAVAVLCVACAEAKAGKLSQYAVSDVTVSGISAGGFMAVQLHVSHSSIVNASAVFAGGPFYCAEGNLMTAEYSCMKVSMGLPDVSKLVKLTHDWDLTGKVDSVANLKDDRIYLFSGSADSVVDPKVVNALQTYYQAFVDVSNIVGDYAVRAQHCQPTLDYGESCATLSSPYIGKCDFDGAGTAFATFFGESNLKARGAAVSRNLIAFDQTAYYTGKYSSIDDTGYIYVPTACASGSTSCHLHIALHGCSQDQASIDTQYAEHAGYNEWAETNNIIVLYPYIKKSMSMPSNPNGCWDWWGYTDKSYGNKEGVQVKFLRDLITAVSGK